MLGKMRNGRYHIPMTTFRMTQIDPTPGQIDLGIGQPGFDLLPLDLLRRAAQQRLQEQGAEWLSYGYEQGDGRFRHALSRLLSRAYHCPVSAADLMVSNGASQGLDLICTLFTQPGNTIFVEEPTYFLALRIFADHSLRVVSIPTTASGLDMDALEMALRQYRPALLYTIPTFQNPSGVTMPQAARERLLTLSEQHGFYIVADEVYHLLRYTAAPPLPLAQFTASERVFSLGSFSKMLAPGLRLGWIQAAPRLLARLTGSGLLDSGGGLNPFTANVVCVALEEGWQAAYLAQVRRAYQRRLAALTAALTAELGDVAQFMTPAGGFFVWVALPEGVNTAALLPIAYQHQTGYQPGGRFSSQGLLRNYLRLCFAFYDEAALAQGVARLRDALWDGGVKG